MSGGYQHLFSSGGSRLTFGESEPSSKSMGGMSSEPSLLHDMLARQAEKAGGGGIAPASAHRTEPNPYSRADMKSHEDVVESHIRKLEAFQSSKKNVEEQYRRFMDEYKEHLSAQQRARVKRAMEAHMEAKRAEEERQRADEEARAEAIKAKARQGEAPDITEARARMAGGGNGKTKEERDDEILQAKIAAADARIRKKGMNILNTEEFRESARQSEVKRQEYKAALRAKSAEDDAAAAVYKTEKERQAAATAAHKAEQEAREKATEKFPISEYNITWTADKRGRVIKLKK